jgi:hypothetical protein
MEKMNKMTKWCILSICEKRGLYEMETFESLEEALASAEKQWNKYLTPAEKRSMDAFCVGMCEMEEDDTFGLVPNLSAGISDIVKDFLVGKEPEND